MTKRRSMKNKQGPLGSRVEVVSGRSNFNYGATTSATIAIQPSTFSRCLAIADVFQFYRFTHVRVQVVPADNSVVLGYAPGALFDTPPTTAASIIELPIALYHGAANFNNSFLNIPRSELLKDAQIPWFKTIVGTPAAQFETQGNVYLVTGAGATGGIVVVEWTCEFQSWNLAGQSPLKSLSAPSEKSSDEGIKDTIMVNGLTYRKSCA